MTLLTRLLAALALATLAGPAAALFISPDPSNPTAPGVGTNRYSYSFNDPVNLRDPSGLAAVYADHDGDGVNEYVGQINPGDPGYGNDFSESGVQASEWIGMRNSLNGTGVHGCSGCESGGWVGLEAYASFQGVHPTQLMFSESTTESGQSPTRRRNLRGLGRLTLLLELYRAGRGHTGERYFHYTNEAGALGIQASGTIRQDDGFVFVTQEVLSPEDAFNSLFIASPEKRAHGDYFVSIAGNEDFTSLLIEDLSIPIGLRHPGSIRHRRGGAFIIGVFPNVFP